MKYLVIINFMVLLLVTNTATCSSVPHYEEYLANDLCAKVIIAIQEKNIDKYLQTYNLDNVDNNEIDSIKRFFTQRIKDNLISVKTQPLDDTFKAEYFSGKYKYRSNMGAIGYVVIETSPQDGGYCMNKIVFGEKNGSYYIAGLIKEELDAESYKSNTFLSYTVEHNLPTTQMHKDHNGCVIYTSGNKKQFEGFCDVMAYNKLFRVDIHGCNGNYRLLDGQYFEYCEVHNLANKGVMKLTLREKGKIVFEEESTELSIIFKSNRTYDDYDKSAAP